jgi:regulator of protease activity HflC (stomatin/prohibitin superfamily)
MRYETDIERSAWFRFHWKRQLLLGGGLLVGLLVGCLLLWHVFFIYVPPGEHLVIIAKDGEPLEPDQVLAKDGQKGIQAAVKGEGWHFVLPVINATSVEKNTNIAPGKVGVITARGGRPRPAGKQLAEEGEQGILRDVLPPGSYRINRYGFDVEEVNAVEIKSGFVGVQRRLLGEDSKTRFADKPTERGILPKVLQPGIYFINPKEMEVFKIEVGIFQTTFHYAPEKKGNTAISFTAKGGFEISLDCTVEWEVRPEEMPHVLAEYGDRHRVEERVIVPQAKAISRNKGIDYGVQDFLDGTKREKFQADFTKELASVCKSKNVAVHSAFIRNIIIPEAYLKPIRDKQVALETELTNKVREATAQSEAEVAQEQEKVNQRVLQVQAETMKLVASIDRDATNVEARNLADIEKLKADYGARIATIDAERTTVLGNAEAEAKKLKETAKSSIYELKMKVFQNDSNAFLRYSLSEQLNPKLVLRLFHSGPGTFWTNMDGKGTNLMLPLPVTQSPKVEK